MDDDQDYYECCFTPNNSTEENKSGVTFKGKDKEYIAAHGKIVDLFKKKGEKFFLNGIELTILDKQKNKPINIELKSKKGFSGKVNLKIYGVNNRGGATMMITKPSGGDLSHAKVLAFDVIKYLLDNIISGNISDEHMDSFKMATLSMDINKCAICEKVFTTEQRLKLHISRFHTSNKEKCDVCGQEFQGKEEVDRHKKREHRSDSSPKAKKLKMHKDKKDSDTGLEEMDIDVEIDEKQTLSKLKDKKVLEKQQSIEKEMELYKQMRRNKEILKEEEEKKRKRQMSVEKKRNKKKSKKENTKEGSISSVKDNNVSDDQQDVTEDVDIGPGYMGHTMDDQPEAKDLSYEEVCQAYLNLKQEYKELKQKYDKLSTDSKQSDDVKDIRKLTSELRSLTGEYKECLQALKKETQDKVKAEETAKVLKSIIEVQDEVPGEKKLESGCDNEEMETDDAVGEWIQQQKRKKVRFQKQKIESFKCGTCEENFPDKDKMKTHEGKHVNVSNTYCSICDEIFVEKQDYAKHIQKHKGEISHKCEVCEKVYQTKSELDLHVKTHVRKPQDQKFNCSKCEKEYSDMSKLRRHDWRSHRQIPCNICGEELQSRQKISEHRNKKHGITQKAVCRFYPNCFDQDECFFFHKEGNQNEGAESIDICSNGENCTDQTCNYSEWKHNTARVLCKFQENCNRLKCPFKHLMPRKAFLGVDISKFKEK